jgi:hypothetical protein
VGVELTPVKLVATGGTGTYTWNVESGSAPGLSFDPATAELKGTPTTAGSFPIKLSATDSESRIATVVVAVTVSPALAIMTERVRAARVGRPYTETLATYGGVGRPTWKVVAGRFPVGVRLNRATGTVFGTPRHAGVYVLTFEVRDALGVTQQVTLKLRVLKSR